MPDDARPSNQPLEIVWLLIELRVEGENDMIPVTMPVPIVNGMTLAELRPTFAHTAAMIEARLAILYDTTWLAGRTWSIYGDRVITQSRARALFPEDPFGPGSRFALGKRLATRGWTMTDALWPVVAALFAVVLGGAGAIGLELFELSCDVEEAMRSWTWDEGGER